MKLNEITQSSDDIDNLVYNDFFDKKDNAFSVMIHNKIWKSFPTQDAAAAAANNCNKMKGRIIAHVVEN